MTGMKAAALAVLAMLAAAPSTSPINKLRKDAWAARTFDYWSLREGRAGPEIKALGAAITADDETACRNDADLEVVMGLETAADAPSATDWRADRDAAARAWSDTLLARSKAVTGVKVDGEYLNKNVQSFVDQATAAPTERAKAVLRRTALDQAILSVGAIDVLSPGAKRRIALLGKNAYCRQAVDNAAWLKRELAKDGWFTISKDGADADKAAWLMVQHSDHDPAFQKQVLGVLTGLKDKGETSRRNYAYLYDRLAANEGRKQLYATQGRCVAGKREPWPAVEDPANLEQRRAEAGLQTLAEYYAYWGPCPQSQ